jgi:hypothetical protein
MSMLHQLQFKEHRNLRQMRYLAMFLSLFWLSNSAIKVQVQCSLVHDGSLYPNRKLSFPLLIIILCISVALDT